MQSVVARPWHTQRHRKAVQATAAWQQPEAATATASTPLQVRKPTALSARFSRVWGPKGESKDGLGE
jgi:hypothetical protein